MDAGSEFQATRLLGPPLAVGRTAEVHAWGDGQVIKLLRPGFPDRLGEDEARAAERVTAAGLAAPRFLGTERVAGRFGLVYERLDGPSMLAVVTRDPERAPELAGRLGELHATMHEQWGDGLPDALAAMRQAIRHASRSLDPVTGDAALSRMVSLPDRTALVHGDLHPGNVLMASGGPVVIDWVTAGAGPPAADVARTLLLLTDTVLGDDIRPADRPRIEELRHRFADAYLARYRQLRPLQDDELQAWRLPVLVARMAEEVAGEEPLLRDQVAAAR